MLTTAGPMGAGHIEPACATRSQKGYHVVISNSRARRTISYNDHRRPVDLISLHSCERFVGTIKLENRNFGTQVDLARQSQEILRVLSRHVRNAANLSLAPKKAVVIEFWNSVQVDRIDRHNH